MPLLVGRRASLTAVEHASTSEGKYLLLVAQKTAEVQDPSAGDLFRVGVVGRVLQVVQMPSGTAKVLVEGVGRVRVTRFAVSQGAMRALCNPSPFSATRFDPEDLARARQALGRFEEYVSLQRRVPAEVVALAQGVEHLERLACLIAAHLAIRHELRQSLLEAPSLEDFYTRLVETLGTEIELLRLERKIDDDVRGSLFRNQREFYLQEQLRAIHRELGHEDLDDHDDLEAQITKRGFPEVVKARAMREVRKLRRMSPLSPEATVGRNYLDWMLALPWSERTDDVLDVHHARRVLDEDHFGLEEVKERILDFIAVLGQVGRLEGPILCLVGPPGVGKTSLGRSIARALGRKFVRMSLGGVRDEAEIRGHRRTYIGALPGRIIQAMRRAEVVNPVLLLDEVDKLGQDYRGDPAAALLEVLDPEQNRAFSDHYLEVDYDLSNVLFLTTANSLAAIPEPLRDRMEILRLAGYLDLEKHAIGRQFLLPRQLERNGVPAATVEFDPDVIPHIVRLYTREAGVRELERRLARVSRKLARRRAERALLLVPSAAESSDGAREDGAPSADVTVATDVTVTDRIRATDLRELLGVPPYDPDETTLEDKIGVANGLAYTSVGGDVLLIEVSVVPGRGKLQLTGTLGDVMKESASAALSYARSRARALGVDPDFYRTRDVHLHIPAGATPKDGPSAGIAIASAMVSALTGRPLRGDVAMTGEVTLRGRVLGIGGLKEKSVAALRQGIQDVIIPRTNAREVEEFPEEVRTGVRFHAVESMDEVLALSLRLPAQAVDERHDTADVLPH
jgi:ATP-dependent Lon protease